MRAKRCAFFVVGAMLLASDVAISQERHVKNQSGEEPSTPLVAANMAGVWEGILLDGPRLHFMNLNPTGNSYVAISFGKSPRVLVFKVFKIDIHNDAVEIKGAGVVASHDTLIIKGSGWAVDRSGVLDTTVTLIPKNPTYTSDWKVRFIMRKGDDIIAHLGYLGVHAKSAIETATRAEHSKFESNEQRGPETGEAASGTLKK